MTTITKKPFGTTLDGQAVTEYTLTNANGSFVKIINYGATVTSITLNTGKGPLDVVLGYNTLEEYEKNDGYLGACIGRVGNRIGGAHFTLNGKEYNLAVNDGENHLHGGFKGFDKYVFDVEEIEGKGIRASRLSADGEENYPGNLKISVEYTWDDNNCLKLAYTLTSDQDTPMNPTNHTYFNLSGENSGFVYDHVLTLNASRFTENDAHCLPTGVLLETAGTPFDFTQPKAIGQDIQIEDEQLINAGGYDHNFVPDGSGMRTMATVYAPDTEVSMQVASDMPGVQFYSGNFLTGKMGKSGTAYEARTGLCLETQFFPNAMACENFPSIVLKKDDVFHSETTYTFNFK